MTHARLNRNLLSILAAAGIVLAGLAFSPVRALITTSADEPPPMAAETTPAQTNDDALRAAAGAGRPTVGDARAYEDDVVVGSGAHMTPYAAPCPCPQPCRPHWTAWRLWRPLTWFRWRRGPC